MLGKSLKKWWWLWLLILFLVIGGVVYFGRNQLSSNQDNNNSATDSAQINIPVEEPPDPKRPVSVLLLGYGGAGHAGGGLTDSMIYAQIEPHEEKVYLLNIPRDFWVDEPDLDVRSKINAIYSQQDVETLEKIVAEIVGVEEIDYYVAVDFNGFKNGLDALTGGRGIWVDVPYSFTDEFYPITGEEDNPCDWSEEEIASLTATMSGYELEKQFLCRYETLSITKGEQLLDTEKALKFVRSRHSGTGGGDFGRAQRQQAFIKGVKDEIFSLGIVTKIPSLWSEYKRSVQTDVDLEIINRAITKWDNLDKFELVSMVMNNSNVLTDGRSFDGQYVLRPKAGQGNYSEIQDFIRVSKIGVDWTEYIATQSATLEDEVEVE